MTHKQTIDTLIKWIERCLYYDDKYNPPTFSMLYLWLKRANNFKREQDDLNEKLRGMVLLMANEKNKVDKLKTQVEAFQKLEFDKDALVGYACVLESMLRQQDVKLPPKPSILTDARED